MEKIHVGANLAEIDLNMRGAGKIFGLKQSGFENFKIADFSDKITAYKNRILYCWFENSNYSAFHTIL